MTPVHTQGAIIANKGWYFLLGNMALSRFKAQQRFNQTPTEDLDIAGAFFKQDLEHGTEKWETWYRLAQTYDTKLSEDLQWSADKINNHRPALLILQRNDNHCYTMAASTAIRCADNSEATNRLVSDLFAEFGFRVYSSSRDPLSMEVFNLEHFSKHKSSNEIGIFQGKPFMEMSRYYAWKFASALFKLAKVSNPKSWM